MKSLRVLVVDDEPAICRLCRSQLEMFGHEVITESDPTRTIDVLEAGSFEAVILDLVMPEQSGLEVLRELRVRWPALPVLVVSGVNLVDIVAEAMRLGASDFVAKPVDATELDLRLRRAYEFEHARRLANTDGLTGLFNHRFLQQCLEREIDRAERYDRPLSLVMVDIDHFKQFNDQFGHLAGDEALVAISETLVNVSRASDIVARYGGEEFVLVLPETSCEKAVLVAERARQCAERLDLAVTRGETEYQLTVSCGVSGRRRGDSREALIGEADAALYEAKRAGRNCVRVAGGGEAWSVEALESDMDIDVTVT
ncbi:MAG: diguanylate cyclase [Thermoanaerobaculia bacterium]|nr:diguanylate cyclase [Thermoanaerobaculia bacterium]